MLRAAWLMLALGCSGRVSSGTPADTAIENTTEAAVVDAIDAIADTPVDPAACSRESDRFAASLSGTVCTTTVRVSSIDLSVLAVGSVCGRSTSLIDEAAARAALKPYLASVPFSADSFSVREAGSATTPWIFYHPPSDFGGVGAVDARTGAVAYYAELSWSALGSTKFPMGAPPPSVCTTSRPKYHVVTPGSDDPAVADRVMDAVARTPVIEGIQRARAITGISLDFVRLDGVGATDAYAKNEWVALIGSALLD